MKQDIYVKQPITVVNNVPVFCDHGEYVNNYEKISQDHIDAITVNSSNPFIADEVWEEIEKNTFNSLINTVKAGDRVLDVGVGTGRLLKHLDNVEKYGIDISLNYLQRLIGSDIEVCMGSVESLPYTDSFFDVIVATDVLEHVIELSTAISEIERVLKPGGCFILRVPYREDLSQYLSSDFPYKYAHVRRFDEFSLEIMFCRVFNFDLLKTMLDYTMYPDALKAKKYFRGRRMLVKTLRVISSLFPSKKDGFMKVFFNPIEITMIFKSK